jgi:predicted AAA+ superfamily ATPase
MVEYLGDAFLLFAVPRFSAKFKQRVTSPPKYYAVDTGFAAANSPNPTPDLGRRLENAVLLALRRSGVRPAFAAAPHEWECDFITPTHAIQCCARLTPENRQRELRGLLQAAALPQVGQDKPRELSVITIDQKDTLSEQGLKIRILPAWEWLD